MLKFLTILKVGLKAIARNKLRSTLTALGIIIGVACVIAMIGVGQGSQAAIQAQISSLGTNFLMARTGARPFRESASNGHSSAPGTSTKEASSGIRRCDREPRSACSEPPLPIPSSATRVPSVKWFASRTSLSG